ncbi:MAG: aminomethyl-transferring glycine dehydrogenase [Planctomycetota bacterium]
MPGDARAVGASILDWSDGFVPRHVGPNEAEIGEMLGSLGYSSMESFIADVVPESIRLGRELRLTAPAGRTPRGEHDLLNELKSIASKNKVWRSCIGQGYHGTITPNVILRNVLENPGWYTAYTPYQPEIAQGRLEALLNFQTMVGDLTGMEIAQASLLDEATAAAEAMAMCVNIAASKPRRFFIADDCHPQTIDVVRTRATYLGIDLVVGAASGIDLDSEDGFAGVLLQYPTTDGRVECYTGLCERAHAVGTQVVAACDLLSLCLLKPPGEWGADIAVGSAQRFGVPMGFGGPHAGFLATAQKHVRRMPGRIVGVSKDVDGNAALRLAIQTREQHIRRDRATSNICTAQVLLAVISGFYACYHGPTGLKRIATRVRSLTSSLRAGLEKLGVDTGDALVFDTLRIAPTARTVGAVIDAAAKREINLRDYGDGSIGITLDETSDRALVRDVLECFGASAVDVDRLLEEAHTEIPPVFERTSAYLTNAIFSEFDSETELLRYIFELQGRDLSLVHSMIALGSCTMKLNGTSEMIPVTWPEFGSIHPFAPEGQWDGYREMMTQLERWLAEITGFSGVSLQPNAGAQGEYAGLLAIRACLDAKGETGRTVCLVPESAHGTNPASAVMAGMNVVVIKSTDDGAIDFEDLRAKVEAHSSDLAALMVTYPSTCGVFEDHIAQVCSLVHEHGGYVYMDGANMNAQVGLCRPGDIGADVCHLNLHKTFCIPHGGGGPGMGPIGVTEELRPHIPVHSAVRPIALKPGEEATVGPVSAAPFGSASILPISWMYIALMGAEGLRKATEVAILSANYMAKRLGEHYDVLFTGRNERVAHEFVIDCRPFDKSAGIKIDDIAKRMIDFGFHAPTMSWPVPGTLMIEPTESEAKPELDRFCDALIAIAKEIGKIESGEWSREDNPLKHAPHTAAAVSADEWDRAYPRSLGAYPAAHLRDRKFWPPVGRVDNPYGDRNLVCSCDGMDAYRE